MARNPGENFEIPAEMRAFAEKSVEQAKQAFEGFITAAQRTVSAFEGRTETARKGAQDIGQKTMQFAERNITTSFDFAQKLVRARDVDEMLRLQADYIRTQMQALAEQAKELGEGVTRTAAETGKSKH
jgi:phasin